MTTPIDKDYVCVIDQGQKKPISPITHTKTVWDEEKQKYIDSIIKDLEYTVGLPITTSLDITEEGKYALDAVAGHRLNEICEKVFQSADNARNYFARIVGIDNPENYNLTTLANKVREYMNELGKAINEKGGNCPTDPTFSDLISCLRNAKYTIKEYEYTFWLSYNDLAKSWENIQNGTGIMDYYEPLPKKGDNTDRKRNFIINLSRKMLMKLSGKDYIPPHENIFMAQFLYPEYDVENKKKETITNYLSYTRNYYSPYVDSNDGTTCPCLVINEKFNNYTGETTLVTYNSRYAWRDDYDSDKEGYDGYKDDGKVYYTPFNSFVPLGTDNNYSENLLYVRINEDYIKSYWSYFLKDNSFDTTFYTKKELAKLKDMRGYGEIEDKDGVITTGYDLGIPFTLKILAKE